MKKDKLWETKGYFVTIRKFKVSEKQNATCEEDIYNNVFISEKQAKPILKLLEK